MVRHEYHLVADQTCTYSKRTKEWTLDGFANFFVAYYHQRLSNLAEEIQLVENQLAHCEMAGYVCHP